MAKIKQNKQRFVPILSEDGDELMQIPVRKATPASMIAVGDLQQDYTEIQEAMTKHIESEKNQLIKDGVSEEVAATMVQVPWELSKKSITLMIQAFSLMIKEYDSHKVKIEDLLGDDFANWGEVFTELLTVYSGGSLEKEDPEAKKTQAQEVKEAQPSPTWWQRASIMIDWETWTACS